MHGPEDSNIIPRPKAAAVPIYPLYFEYNSNCTFRLPLYLFESSTPVITTFRDIRHVFLGPYRYFSFIFTPVITVQKVGLHIIGVLFRERTVRSYSSPWFMIGLIRLAQEGLPFKIYAQNSQVHVYDPLVFMQLPPITPQISAVSHSFIS